MQPSRSYRRGFLEKGRKARGGVAGRNKGGNTLQQSFGSVKLTTKYFLVYLYSFNIAL